MIWTDIREIKRVLDIHPSDNSEDVKLTFFNEWASGWLEELLNRPLTLKSRTEYYDGALGQKLILRSRPVFATPAPQVYIDEAGFYASASGAFTATDSQLTYGTHFCLKLDPGEDGVSRSGILVRINNYWPKPSVRQRGLLSPFVGEGFGTIKVIYTAGYTIDTLPAQLRAACNLLVARLRYLFPLGMELSSDSYEERSIGLVAARDDYILSMVKPMVLQHRNWRW